VGLAGGGGGVSAQPPFVQTLFFPHQPQARGVRFCEEHHCPLLLTAAPNGQRRWECMYESLYRWLGGRMVHQVLWTDTGGLALLVFENGYALKPLCSKCGQTDLVPEQPLTGLRLQSIAWPPEQPAPNLILIFEAAHTTAQIALGVAWASLGTVHQVLDSPAVWTRPTTRRHDWEAL
jgi:hypothetical protein